MDQQTIDRLIEGAERIASLEAKVDQLLLRPDHVVDIAKVKQNLRIVNWAGALVTASVVGSFIKWAASKFPF